jgi:MFS family permease
MRPLSRLFLASTISNLGDGVLLASLPLLARSLSDDPLAVSLVTVAATSPWLVLGLVAGVVVDRVDRVRLMVGVDVVRALVLGGFAALVAVDAMTLPIAVVLVFVAGSVETLFDTAAQAVVPALVDGGDLERANGRLFGAQLAANGFAGPPLGALLFGLTAAAPFALDAASFAVSAALVLRLPVVGTGAVVPARARTTTIRTEVREGLAWLWSDPGVRAFAVGAAVVNIAHTAAMAVAVLFVRDELGASTTGFGLALAGMAVGGLAGSFAAAHVVQRVGRRRAVLGSLVAFSAALVAAGAAPHVVAATLGIAVFNAAGEVWNVVAVSYRQARVPDHLLGRVMASYRVIAYGAMPLGALLGGVVAGAFGLRAPFVVGAVLVAALLVWFAPATRATLNR